MKDFCEWACKDSEDVSVYPLGSMWVILQKMVSKMELKRQRRKRTSESRNSLKSRWTLGCSGLSRFKEAVGLTVDISTTQEKSKTKLHIYYKKISSLHTSRIKVKSTKLTLRIPNFLLLHIWLFGAIFPLCISQVLVWSQLPHQPAGAKPASGRGYAFVYVKVRQPAILRLLLRHEDQSSELKAWSVCSRSSWTSQP